MPRRTVAGDGHILYERAHGFFCGGRDRGERVADVAARALPDGLAGGGIDESQRDADRRVAVEVGLVTVFVHGADEEMRGVHAAREFGVAAVVALRFVGGGFDHGFFRLEKRDAGFDERAAGHFGEGAAGVLVVGSVDEFRHQQAGDHDAASGSAAGIFHSGTAGEEHDEAGGEDMFHGRSVVGINDKCGRRS